MISKLALQRTFATATSPATSLASSVTLIRKGEQPASSLPIQSKVSSVSGLTLATVDEQGPASSLAVIINAGSRFESPDAPGVSHALKATLLRNVPGANITRTVREAELRGNSLFSSHTREHIILGSTFLRDDLVDVVPTLLSQVSNTSFYPHEFLDALPRIAGETESALGNPFTQVVESLHRVAFRSGLGSPLFASEDALDALKRSDLLEFASKYFTADRIAIVGTGVAHSDLVAAVEKLKLNLSSASVETKASRYFGGEARLEGGPHSESHLAIAFPGTSYTSSSYPASLVLKALLDGSSRVQWGNPSGPLGKLAGSSNVSATAFSTSYTDSGLFGIYLTGDASQFKTVGSKALAELKKVAGGVSSGDLARAKKAAIVDGESFTREESLELYGKQALALKQVHTLEALKALESVTASDVEKLAKSIVSGKPSVVAYGNLAKIPHFDEL